MSTTPVPLAGGPIEIVTPRPWPQRVLLQSVSLGVGDIFVSSSGAAGIGPKAIQISVPAGAQPVVPIVVAPGQGLYALSDTANGIVSAAVSGAIQLAQPKGPKGHDRTKMGAAQFSSMTIAVDITESAASPQIVPVSDMPRRVVITMRDAVGGSRARIAFSAGAARSQPQSFLVSAGSLYIFVVAPGQQMYASTVGDTTRVINTQVSDLVVSAPRGATGLPGPAGQE